MPPRQGVIIRCDGAADIGLGHLVRCIALADELRDKHQCRVKFLVRRGDIAVKMIRKAGHPMMQPPHSGDRDDTWISRVILDEQPAALVMDFRERLAPEIVWEWRRQGTLIVSIEDLEDKRVACNLIFFPPIPQVDRLDWTGFTGELYTGWKWVLLRRQFASITRGSKRNSRPHILVAMGGSDPAGMTLTAVKALAILDDAFDSTIVLGAAFCHDAALQRILSSIRRPINVRRDVDDMASLMAGTDFAVASFCMTAYELAAAGVPGIFLCLTEDHAQSASTFVRAGMGISLGVYDGIKTEEALREQISGLLRDPGQCLKMAGRCRQLVDGCGAERIAGTIAERLNVVSAPA